MGSGQWVCVLLASALVLSACGGGDDSKSGQASAETPGGRGGAAPGGAGGPGGRGRSMSVTLAASDISPVKRGTVEDAVAVTGNLQPLERVEVRARLEGEVESVMVREGDRVRPGQVLARFEANEQQSAFESAQADRSSRSEEHTSEL